MGTDNGIKSRQIREQVSAYIRQLHMIRPGDKVILGLSGGADSVCLFELLMSLREEMVFTIEAVHVNHMLRETAERDEVFVRQLCEKNDIPLHVLRKDVALLAKQKAISPEEAGREVRYTFFNEVAEKTGADRIATAHHANDRAETVLFHLGRGTGVDGLCGIRPIRDKIIRPLLCLGREEIEQYLSLLGREYMTDETNADNTYSRNRIRNEILPMLEEVCPGAMSHIAATGELMSQVSDYLKYQTEEAVSQCVDREHFKDGCLVLFCHRWKALHEYMQGEVIRICICMLAESKKDISKVHVEAVQKLAELQVGSKCDLPYGIVAEKSYDTILFQRKAAGDTDREEPFCVTVTHEQLECGIQVQLPDGMCMHLIVEKFDSEADIPTKPYTKWLNYDKIVEPLVIRHPRQNDFFYLNYKNKKYVKDYMVNEKIPLMQRKKSILVASGDHILYFVGRRISHRAKTDDTTKKILKITVTGG